MKSQREGSTSLRSIEEEVEDASSERLIEIGDEIEAVREILGADTYQAGFYSYGEISPHNKLGTCELHNQTMTVTLFAEDA